MEFIVYCPHFVQGQVLPFDIPEITNDTTVDDLIEQATKRIYAILGLDNIPDYAKEDGNDIIRDLVTELSKCRDELAETRSMKEFRSCVRGHVDHARDKIWEFDYDLEASAANSFRLCKYLILPAFLTVFHYTQRLSHALIASNTWK